MRFANRLKEPVPDGLVGLTCEVEGLLGLACSSPTSAVATQAASRTLWREERHGLGVGLRLP